MIRTTAEGNTYEAKMDGAARRIILVDGEAWGSINRGSDGYWSGEIADGSFVGCATIDAAYECVDKQVDYQQPAQKPSAAPEKLPVASEPDDGPYDLAKLLAGLIHVHGLLATMSTDTADRRGDGSPEAMANRFTLGEALKAMDRAAGDFDELILIIEAKIEG